MIPDLLATNSYDYYLPKELIAQYPAEQRTASRLMHIKRNTGEIAHRQFTDILELIKEGDLVILNSSKVFPARLFAEKENGTKVEILLLYQLNDNKWKCMASPGKRLKQPQYLHFSENLSGFISSGDREGLREIDFTCQINFWEEIQRIGHIPLPPYIERNDTFSDRERYQTVYAKEIGSIAAPTAGFHFDNDILDALRDKGVLFSEVILHIGIGTFRPVKTEYITEHHMHSELATIPESTAEAINIAKKEGRRVICIGTTSTRSVESFWQEGKMQSGSKWTDIFIYPGFQFQVTDALLTNFHLPKSTLLMMISAFGGFETIQKAYRIAVERKYRFFSYGDAMFIED
jgi:S-adenosylmethionine:tRNA ribosyltransferase-isomerase